MINPQCLMMMQKKGWWKKIKLELVIVKSFQKISLTLDIKNGHMIFLLLSIFKPGHCSKAQYCFVVITHGEG